VKVAPRLAALTLCFAIALYGEGNTFDKVRYNGGSVDSKVDPKDWHNQLTVTSDLIVMVFKDGKRLEIAPKSVTSLSYGQEAHRRVGTMVALAILVSPVALFGLMHKTRLHYIGIQYHTADGKHAGILLQGDKDNYRAILVALQGVTGIPVFVSEKDHEFVPVGVTTTVTKPVETDEVAKPADSTSMPAQEHVGTINISSVPAGADISVDGSFVGNSPASLKLSAGKHTIMLKLTDYADWSRGLTVEPGSEVQLTATLEKH
jgi:hypothetical protein